MYYADKVLKIEAKANRDHMAGYSGYNGVFTPTNSLLIIIDFK